MRPVLFHLWRCSLLALLAGPVAAEPPVWPGFVASPWFGEQVREARFERGARGLVIAPLDFDATRPTQLVVYATPNGNTVEQTLGCQLAEGRDWHFDIQHVAAQVRRLREVDSRENRVLACIQPEPLSWPAWRGAAEGSDSAIHAIVDSLAALVPGEVHITLSGHSGGGSFLFGYLNSADEVPDEIRRIVFLDANYAYADEEGHGDKLLRWLAGNLHHHLVSIAYDDREITYNGKKVVGPTGGTFRASHRMLARLRQDVRLEEDGLGDFARHAGLGGRLTLLVHPNPDNAILHTRLVGEMNGLLYGLTLGTPAAGAWGKLGEPRAYADWVQPDPFDPSQGSARAPQD